MTYELPSFLNVAVKMRPFPHVIERKTHRGSFINHVGRFFDIYDPLLLSGQAILLKLYVLYKWTFGKPLCPCYIVNMVYECPLEVKVMWQLGRQFPIPLLMIFDLDIKSIYIRMKRGFSISTAHLFLRSALLFWQSLVIVGI